MARDNVKPGAAGSIEQQLDMNETGSMRGDEILHNHGIYKHRRGETMEDQMNRNFSVDMSEDNREGDEMSGDDHSMGLQGGEAEIENQPHISTGMPGSENEEEEMQQDEMSHTRRSA